MQSVPHLQRTVSGEAQKLHKDVEIGDSDSESQECDATSEVCDPLNSFGKRSNEERLHQSLKYATPGAVYRQGVKSIADTTLK